MSESTEDCLSCGEEMPRNECPKSPLECGHHCNCSWIHDHCHFCTANFGEEDRIISYGWPPPEDSDAETQQELPRTFETPGVDAVGSERDRGIDPSRFGERRMGNIQEIQDEG